MTAYDVRISDWSSDVCSSDLPFFAASKKKRCFDKLSTNGVWLKGSGNMSIHIGIGGWTFEPWRGPFYPTGLAQKRELEYAGQDLTGIESNGTYYGRQKPETCANWAESDHDGFKFSVQATGLTTNSKVLKEENGR